jgi:hypothetical protein
MKPKGSLFVCLRPVSCSFWWWQTYNTRPSRLPILLGAYFHEAGGMPTTVLIISGSRCCPTTPCAMASRAPQNCAYFAVVIIRLAVAVAGRGGLPWPLLKDASKALDGEATGGNSTLTACVMILVVWSLLSWSRRVPVATDRCNASRYDRW